MSLAISSSLPAPAQKALRGDGFPKFAATRSNDGVPNVVPLLSTTLADEHTLIFVRMMIWKTAQNLLANGRITINVMGPGLNSWLILGEFVEFVRQGPYLDYFNRKAMFRYNAYSGAGEVGVIRVKETRGPVPIGLVTALFYNLLREPPRPAGHPGGASEVMPAPVREKFSRRLLALKHLGFVEDDGTPVAVPCLELYARSAEQLVFLPPKGKAHPLSRLCPGMKVAASVFTLAPVAFQVKGVFVAEEVNAGGQRQGVIQVQESYTAAPPVPGRRIFPPETYT